MAFRFRGKTALITGAANGIGRALSLEVARRHARVVLVDRDAARLETVVDEIVVAGGEAFATTCDLTRPTDIEALVDTVRGAGMSPDCLVNNAGVGSMGLFDELEIDEFEKIFAVNFWAPLRLIRAFLPDLRERRPARIVNISSVLGLIGVPDQSAYVASKFALRGLSESLSMELNGSSVGVSVVYPGGVATEITNHALIARRLDKSFAEDRLSEFAATLKLGPTVAARIIADGIKHERARILVGHDCRNADRLQRILPSSYGKILARRLKTKAAAALKRGTADDADNSRNAQEARAQRPADRPTEE